MKRWIFILMVILLAAVQPVFAQSGITVIQQDGSNSVTVSVDTDIAERSQPVSLKILDNSGKIHYLDSAYTDDDGKCSFSYINDGEAGNYRVIASSKTGLLETSFEKVQPMNLDVMVEGENYKEIGFAAEFPRDLEDMSGGSVLKLIARPVSGSAYEVSYDVNVLADGNYNLSVVSSAVGVSWTNDYSVSVNGETEVAATDGKLLSEPDTPSFPGVLRKYDFGSFYFHAGTNTVKFMIDLNDTRWDGNIVFFLDYFTLINTEISTLNPSGPCGVYEENTDVTYDVLFGRRAIKDNLYNLTVTDFWGETVFSNTVECPKGALSIPVNLGRFCTGWYKFRVYENDSETLLTETTFSVVPPLDKRVQGDTPFAADFASPATLKGEKRIDEMAQTLKYAGITWARERYDWPEIQPSKDEYKYDILKKRVDAFADKGIQTSVTYSTTPDWTNINNLFDVYNFHKNTTEELGDSVGMWEMWNEQDGVFLYVPADTYSAYYKAAALGAIDGDADAKVSFGGLCNPVKGNLFTNLMMENEVMSYSNIYNLHSHSLHSETVPLTNLFNKEMLQTHREMKMRYGEQEPFWITEAGLSMPLGKNKKPTEKQLAAQANYAVISTVQSLASGASKHFWFIWPEYLENGNEWGVFDSNDRSNPVYAAEAVMTYVLGKGTYKGAMEIDGAEGYVFDNGTNDVLVAWSDTPKTITLHSDKEVRVTNLMGLETTVHSENGTVSIELSSEPVYISFDGALQPEEYYPMQYSVDNDRNLIFDDAQRIVLQQKFEGQDPKIMKYRGYECIPGKTEQITVKVYNFNDKAMTGTIHGKMEGFDVQIANPSVKVGAMSSVDVSVMITPTGEAVAGKTSYLKFTGIFDDKETSPSVSAVRLRDTTGIEPKALFENQEKANSWNVAAISGGSSATATEQADGSLKFQLDFSGTGWWFFPTLDVNNASVLKDTDGIVFWSKADSGSAGAGSHNMIVYLNDGRQYYLGDEVSSTYLTDDWVQIKIPWSDFVLQYSPLGIGEARSFDPTLISKIALGGNNFSQNSISYCIKEVAYYAQEKQQEEPNVIFVNLSEGGEYCSGELNDIQVTNVKNQKLRMILNDETFYTASADETTLHLNFSGLCRGKYTLRVVSEDANGYKESETVTFYVADERGRDETPIHILSAEKKDDKIEVHVLLNVNQDVQLILAGYSNDFSCDSCIASLLSGKRYVEQTVTFSIPQGDILKLFVWDSFENMIPCAETINIGG